MARVPITEYKAKKLLLGDTYKGVSVVCPKSGKIPRITLDAKKVYVVKVDQATKKRMKRNLAALNVTPKKISAYIHSWMKLGFNSFVVEEMLPHEQHEELYLSFERSRHGIIATFSRAGGVDIEDNKQGVERYEIKNQDDAWKFASKKHIPNHFIEKVWTLFQEAHCSLIELNPIIIRSDKIIPLDAAMLVDDTADAKAFWNEHNIAHPPHDRNAYEDAVAALARTTPASLKLRVMNKDGSIFFLLSGGGGSLAIVDAVYEAGKAELIGNYGEYSGGPTQEETYLYSKTVIELMLSSKSSKKVLVIAGGIANFTDIKTTFSGIIEAIEEYAEAFVKQKIHVAVRRGGPREREGLESLGIFLVTKGISHTLHGSGAVITEAVRDALHVVGKKAKSHT